MENSKGPIAETYVELQGLPALERASRSYATEKCSTWGIVKVILQAVEIGIQNLNDLLGRIINDLDKNEIGNATIKLGWLKDINNLLISISNLKSLVCNEFFQNTSNSFDIESQIKLTSLCQKLDISFEKYLTIRSIDISGILETKTLSNDIYKFLHDYRIIAHELTIWNKNLQQYAIPANTNYSDFIGLRDITTAVNNPGLKGDTFFTQFRCLHQIPELITSEVNNRIEYATIEIRNFRNDKAHLHLRIANELLILTFDSFKPLIDNLSHNDYHQFREYLGLTSGSHSVSLHFHLFRDLYHAITMEYIARYFKDEQSYKSELAENYSVKMIETELFKLRNSINHWRDIHLHLPRIDLGENKTKSLIGSNEAVETARAMQATAHSRDPLNKIADLYVSTDFSVKSKLTDYIRSEKSFDFKLGDELGKITKKRFQQVQERQGVFAKPIPFTPPQKRIV